MIIPKFNFPFYGLIIVFSIFIGMFYIYYNLRKERYKNKQVLLYFIMYVAFSFIGGKIYTVFAYGESNFLNAGLSAYGGLIGVVIASIIFEKILPSDGKVIKYTILSLPLVYGLTKIGCSIVGCCGGILYEGIFKVKYIDALNIWQFPVQLCEVIVFLLIFFLSHLFKKRKNINYIVLILVSIFKFLLDFFRYDHIDVLITRNQIFSVVLLVIVIMSYVFSNMLTKHNN